MLVIICIFFMILPFRNFIIRVVVNIEGPNSILGRIVVFIKKEITFRRRVSAFYGGNGVGWVDLLRGGGGGVGYPVWGLRIEKK